jgi:hypothetical protein
MKGFFVVFITAFVLTWLASRARATKAHKVGNTWVFPPVGTVHVLYSLVLAIGTGLAFFSFRGPQEDKNLTISIGLSFVIFALITWPKAVEVSELGLRQRSWYGGCHTISWPEVSDIQETRDGSVVVRGLHSKIVLSPYHADRDLFLQDVHDKSRRSRMATA